jgi:hypothetical protein
MSDALPAVGINAAVNQGTSARSNGDPANDYNGKFVRERSKRYDSEQGVEIRKILARGERG